MENNLNEVLVQAKDLLKGEISELSYKTWILPLEISNISDNNVVLISDDSFKKDSSGRITEYDKYGRKVGSYK